MLSLDDPLWHGLCSRGNVADLPGLLRTLQQAATPQQTAALTAGLAAYLCPDDEIYSAAYAVLPYLVELAAHQPPGDRLPALGLAGRVAALAQRSDAPAVPPELHDNFAAALARAADLVLECLRLPQSASDLAALCGTLAAARGHGALAIDLMETLRDPRQVQCPVCEQFYASLGYELIHGPA